MSGKLSDRAMMIDRALDEILWPHAVERMALRDMNDELSTLRAEVEVLLMYKTSAAEKWSFESEYDGRMEEWCFYCNTIQNRRPSNKKPMHKPDCLHIAALVKEQSK